MSSSDDINQALLAALPDTLVRVRRDGTITQLRLPRWIGSQANPEDWQGHRLQDLFPPEQVQLWMARIEHVIVSNDVVDAAFSLALPERHWFFDVRMSRVSESEVIALARDVTAREEAKKEAAEQQKMLYQFAETAPLIMYVYDIFLKKNVFINRSLVAELGYDAETCARLDDNPMPELLHPEDMAVIIKAMEALFQMPDGHVKEETARLRHADGDWRWYRSRSKVFSHNAEGIPQTICGTLEDVTEKQSLDDQLRQAEKMEVVGLLAGALAHDFNNVLTAILGYSQVLMETLGDPQDRADANEIYQAAQRAAVLTRRLLSYARRENRAPEVVDVQSTLLALVPMLRRLAPDVRHVLKVLSSGNNLRIRIDSYALEQILVNLFVNARDAMAEGGSIEIRLSGLSAKMLVDRPSHISPDQPIVMLSMRDEGSGIPPELHRRVFEPFFTTKPRGQGTGLGLPSVQRLVQEAGGWVQMESEMSKGTTFNLYFPQVQEAAPPTVGIAVTQRAQGRERVLAADDDPSIRAYLQSVLTRDGYDVHVAVSKAEALQLLRNFSFDVLISDVHLGEDHGPDLVAAALKIQRHLRILYISAYTDIEVQPLLHKPFTSESLSGALRAVLDQA